MTAPTGLVAAYGFDEGSGTTTADQSGNGNAGALSNTVWSTGGKFNNALSFNGSARVNVNDSASLRLTSGMTVEAWVRPSALGDWRTVVLKERTGYYAYALYANTDNSRPSAHVFTQLATTTCAGTAALPVNAWTHLAATYNGSVARALRQRHPGLLAARHRRHREQHRRRCGSAATRSGASTSSA